MRTAYISTLSELANQNKNILALISDNGAIVYDEYREKFPNQYINFGISEANMVAVAAGLASCGKIPFAYTISNFLTMRAFEFIRNDACLQNQNVKLVGTGAGFIYSTLGPTHHATEDIAIMRVLPGITIFSPASPMDVKKTTLAAAEIVGPVYIRLGTNKEPEIYNHDYKFEVGKGVIVKEGTDFTIISTGTIVNQALYAAEELNIKGISVRVINMHTLKPIDEDIIINAAKETNGLITLEEHNILGGLGSIVAEVLAESELLGKVTFKRMGLKDCFCKGYGTHKELMELNGLSKDFIKNKIIDILKEKK